MAGTGHSLRWCVPGARSIGHCEGSRGFRLRPSGRTDRQLPALLYFSGFLAIAVASMISGFSGVYLEMLLKEANAQSLWVGNLQMTVVSIPFTYFAAYAEVLKDEWEAGRMESSSKITACSSVSMPSSGSQPSATASEASRWRPASSAQTISPRSGRCGTKSVFRTSHRLSRLFSPPSPRCCSFNFRRRFSSGWEQALLLLPFFSTPHFNDVLVLTRGIKAIVVVNCWNRKYEDRLDFQGYESERE